MRIRRQSTMAAAVAVVAWLVARHLIPTHAGDAVESRHVARLIGAGLIPYRDFDVHLPPLATAVSWLIASIPGPAGTVDTVATAIALGVGAAATWAVAHHLTLSPWRRLLALALVTSVPLIVSSSDAVVGGVLLTAVLACSLLAALQGRFIWMWGSLAVAAGIGVAPLLVFPVAAVWHGARTDRAHAIRALVVALGAVVATFVPFIVVAPAGMWHLAQVQLTRPLPVESIGAELIRVAHLPFRPVVRTGGAGMEGTIPTLIGVASTGALLLAILAIVALTVRMRPSDHGMVGAVGATLLAIAVFGAVVTAGNALWLIPAAALIPGRLGAVCAIAVAVAMPVARVMPTDVMEQSASHPALAFGGRTIALLLAMAAAAAVVLTKAPSRSAKPPYRA